ncbi:MAG: DUF488 domain-containing protein [Gammaproteobacteria bacterium]|jgi:uncharacterized protein (DUF488 family)
MSAIRLYSVGLSNRTLEELVNLLRYTEVQLVIDVRAYAVSPRYPQFAVNLLQAGLAVGGMRYQWAGLHLGARRAPRPDSPHVGLANETLRGYADQMTATAFHGAIMELVGLAAFNTVALLGEEYLPERCHRSLIADYLTLHDVRVVHLLDEDFAREHELRPEVRRSEPLVYDRVPVAYSARRS